jgi:hypothetical protein
MIEFTVGGLQSRTVEGEGEGEGDEKDAEMDEEGENEVDSLNKYQGEKYQENLIDNDKMSFAAENSRRSSARSRNMTYNPNDLPKLTANYWECK